MPLPYAWFDIHHCRQPHRSQYHCQLYEVTMMTLVLGWWRYWERWGHGLWKWNYSLPDAAGTQKLWPGPVLPLWYACNMSGTAVHRIHAPPSWHTAERCWTSYMYHVGVSDCTGMVIIRRQGMSIPVDRFKMIRSSWGWYKSTVVAGALAQGCAGACAQGWAWARATAQPGARAWA